MNITQYIIYAAFVVLVLSSCSEFQHRRDTALAPVVTLGYGTDYWLAELNSTRQMMPEERARTVEAWQQELDNEPDDGNRIRLALLLTVGDEQIRDPARASKLLDELDAAPAKASEKELVTIMRLIIDEQTRAGESISKLNRQLGKQNRRIRELEQQQRALTNIEQNIEHRDSLPASKNGEE